VGPFFREEGEEVRGHIAKKRDRYYLVFDVGSNPATGKRRQRWHSGPDRKGWTSKRAAEVALRHMLTDHDEGAYVDPAAVTVGDYLEAWLPAMRLRPSTMSVYRVQLSAYVLPRIGAIRLQQLTSEHLSALYVELERAGGRGGKPLSAKTVRNVAVMLHRALDAALRRTPPLIARNPAVHAEKPKPRRYELRPWSAEETATFLNAAVGDRLAAAFWLMASAGVRRGETLGLMWRDLDLDRGTASIRRALVLAGSKPVMSEPKTEAGRRSIPLATQAVSALRSHRRRQTEERLAFADVHVDQDLVFAQEDGSPIHPDRLLDAFHRISEGAGLRRTRPHDLRHGWATRALEAGVPAKVVQEVLGHRSAMVTLDVYSHVVPSMKADATQLVADQFGTDR
jgi:integrase